MDYSQVGVMFLITIFSCCYVGLKQTPLKDGRLVLSCCAAVLSLMGLQQLGAGWPLEGSDVGVVAVVLILHAALGIVVILASVLVVVMRLVRWSRNPEE